MTNKFLRGLVLVLAGVLTGGRLLWAIDDFEREPINYSQATPDNAVSRLQQRVDSKTTQLAYEPHFGYLKSLLKELDIPQSSQTLVFSKTSFQRQRINPKAPRSLYFNDEVYLGFCQNGEVLEISVADAQLGTVFYSLDQDETAPTKFLRQTDNCLICHGSSQTQNVPGHIIRSVFPDAGGEAILSAGTYRIDHTSPFEKRWGGWYVTGHHGSQKHLGNLVVKPQQIREGVDNTLGQNVTDLSEKFRTKGFVTPNSDIVALMVLEHQAMAHNLLTQASFTARQATHYEATLNKELGKPEGHRWDSTNSRIKSVGEPLVKYLLFSGEAKLTEQVRGNTSFAEEFSARGPRDSQGRSFRDFDLSRRMFRYPCSYLIYSPSFRTLPVEMQGYVWGRFAEILSGRDQTPEFAHLSPEDRTAIREILSDTYQGLPEGWLAQAVMR